MAIKTLTRFFKPSPIALPPADADEDVVLPTDTSREVRLGLTILGISFGGFLLWAAVAPLDEGVPTQGMVSIDTKRKTVQHLEGGIIRDVLVREGQTVEAGQVLIRLENGKVKADYESARQSYFGLAAMENRLLAEQLGEANIDFDPQLLEAAQQDPYLQRLVSAQQKLFISRRESLAASLHAIQESMRGQEAIIHGYAEVQQNRSHQLELLNREVSGIRNLVKVGYAPLIKQMELERSMDDVMGSIADLKAKQIGARQLILEYKQREIMVRSEYRKEVDKVLTDVRGEIKAASERYKVLSGQLARTEIRSPATGQVVGLMAQTVGGVIQPGQPLMDIVPADDVLLLETRILPFSIDRVHVGDPVDVRFSTFSHSPSLVVDGKLASISGDVLTDRQTGLGYYLARVSLTPDGMKKLGSHKLQPGMPVEVVIKTGRRTLLTYLLHPLLKRVAASLKEE